MIPEIALGRADIRHLSIVAMFSSIDVFGDAKNPVPSAARQF